MVYPVFDYDSIEQRCKQDLVQFKESTKHSSNLSFILYYASDATLESMKENIQPILSFLLEHLGENDYVDEISHSNNQQELWIARTYLFYQLLIFATMTFQSEQLYKEVYASVFYTDYRYDISKECMNFKMGIFGSLTPTSDIDLGIQYSGTGLSVGGLDYVVAAFESLFLIFTGKPSLAFDIETYADMMTIPNLNEEKKDKYPDMFYLDSSIFRAKHFQKMLSCAYNSIARNILLAYDKQKPSNSRNVKEMKRIYQSVTNPFIQEQLLNETLYQEALDRMSSFLKMDYDSARRAYYEKVKRAEESKDALLKDDVLRNSDRIAETMFLIGDALSYRMESYTCAPTVIHVVRILQASKNSITKYKTTEPANLCQGESQFLDPFCSIGYYGFVLSAMEQIGYMYRFHTTYCIQDKGHYNNAKCKKKQDKYAIRLQNAQEFLERLRPLSNQSTNNFRPFTPAKPSRRVSFGGKNKTKKKRLRARSTRRKH
uniref:Uncharacterized protein n=1 Tax=viral metagenome TaxID=1070528 RepID=A0A6C0KTV6_9ZZZZ